MRRSNIEKVTPNTFNYREDGTPYQIRLCNERKYGGADWSEKGGRDRIVDIPEQYQERIKEVIEEHRANGYDVGALKYTTEQLGHNRLDVVVYNYLKAR